MAVAAVPEYLGSEFKNAYPGMRHGLLLELWGKDERSKKFLWKAFDCKYVRKGQDQAKKMEKHENKKSAILKSAKINEAAKSLSANLQDRQKSIVESLDMSKRLSIYAKSTAPFVTGLGNEHPLENGFSFLNPYALPYFPGSGVKGVLRQAAKELADGAWGDNKGWSDDIIRQLFGSALDNSNSIDKEESFQKGALSFWDVFPQAAQDELAVEVMTPHQTHYYQDEKSPHDSGQPNPILFLAVPARSKFFFHVTCDLKRIKTTADDDLATEDQWKNLLIAAFKHAFDWIGFGAKTAVGYGAMEFDQEEIEKNKKIEAEKSRQRELESAIEGKPDDVVWIVRREKRWVEPNHFLDDMDEFFSQFTDHISGEVYEMLEKQLSKRWPGILKNPDAVQGKKKKPKYNSRPVQYAKSLLAKKPVEQKKK